MKKLLLTVFLVLGFMVVASAQKNLDRPVEIDTLVDSTDGTRTWRISGTADDVSIHFKNAGRYNEVSVWGNAKDDTVGTDSVKVYVVLEGSQNEITWIPLDSLNQTTEANFIYSFTLKGPMEFYRFRLNGYTDNGFKVIVGAVYGFRKKQW